MENIFHVLPKYIPPEIQSLIHFYAGTCTPSCKHIKLYKDKLANSSSVTRTDSLWGTLMTKVAGNITWCRNKKWLKNHELDLQIAYQQITCDKCMARHDTNEIEKTLKTSMRISFIKLIQNLQEELTFRVHQIYRRNLEQEMVEQEMVEMNEKV